MALKKFSLLPFAAAQLSGLQMPPMPSQGGASAVPAGVQMPPGMMSELSGGKPGSSQQAPPGAPTMAGGMAPAGQQQQVVDPLQKMQDEMQASPKLDALCPGMNRKSKNIGMECWKKVWTFGGCKEGNLPPYGTWHQVQSLEILAVDVVQWANLPDKRHVDGCHGDAGPPPDLPMPNNGQMGGLQGGSPMPGAKAVGGMMPPGMPAGMPQQQGGMMPPQQQGGMMPGAPGQQQQQPQMSQEEAALMQAVNQAVDQLLPEMQKQCSIGSPKQTNIGADCWAKAWSAVGCLPDKTPAYEKWHQGQSLEMLIADAAQWAALPTEKHRMGCYGKLEL